MSQAGHPVLEAAGLWLLPAGDQPGQQIPPGQVAYDFSTASLYDVLRNEYQVFPSRGEFTIRAEASAPPVSDHLEISPGYPVLIFSQTTRDQLGRAAELAETTYRADRYLFRGTLSP